MPQIKVSERTKKELERLKSERFKGLSFSDIILHLIRKFEEKDEKAPEMKWITTKYAGKCARCGREIQIGERVLWAPGTLVCFECGMKSYADDKVFQKYVILAEIKAAVKGAKKELERLGGEIKQKREELERLKAEIRDNKALAEKMREAMVLLDGFLEPWWVKRAEERGELERRKIELYEKLLSVMKEIFDMLIALGPALGVPEPETPNFDLRKRRRAKARARW